MQKGKQQAAISPSIGMVFGSLLLLGGLSGCVQTATRGGGNYADGGGLMAPMATQACQGSVNPVHVDKTVEVRFRETTPNVWCPYEVSDPCVEVFKNKNIAWQAVKKASGETGDIWEPYAVEFEVYFSAIHGHSIKSNNNGFVQRPIDPDSPSGLYKYTVWDWQGGASPHQCDPLDPNYRVN